MSNHSYSHMNTLLPDNCIVQMDIQYKNSTEDNVKERDVYRKTFDGTPANIVERLLRPLSINYL